MKGKEIVNTFEQSDKILAFRYHELGIPLWPFVRFIFLDFFSARANRLSETSIGVGKAEKIVDLLKSLIKSYYHNPYSLAAKDVLFFNTGITNIKLENGKYFNRVTDYFYFQTPEHAALIEDLYKYKLISPRVHHNVYSYFPFRLNSSILNIFAKKALLPETTHDIEQLIEYLRSVSPIKFDKSFWDECRILFINRVSIAKTEVRVHKKFLKEKGPKLIFLEDAAYGSKLPLLLASKELNIPVAELQHGLINENHLAYQFGESVVHDLLPYLPDYFLTYSSYWANSVNLPSVKIVIGNPYLAEYLQRYPKNEEKKILILGTGTSKDQLISFCIYLYKNIYLQHYRFVLRPHPWERAVAAEKYAALLEIGYEIDTVENIYQSLSTSAIVFGEMSTAIFEASVYKIPTFLIATDHCKTNKTEETPFPVVEIGPAIMDVDFLSSTEQNKPEIWVLDWEARYQQFLKMFIQF